MDPLKVICMFICWMPVAIMLGLLWQASIVFWSFNVWLEGLAVVGGFIVMIGLTVQYGLLLNKWFKQ